MVKFCCIISSNCDNIILTLVHDFPFYYSVLLHPQRLAGAWGYLSIALVDTPYCPAALPLLFVPGFFFPWLSSFNQWCQSP